MTAQTPQTPETPEPETIIELVSEINPWLLVAAFIVGAFVVAGAVAYLGRKDDTDQ